MQSFIFYLSGIFIFLFNPIDKKDLPLLSKSDKIQTKGFFTPVFLVNLPDTELGILVDFKKDNSFKEYYLFQYNKTTNMFNISESENVFLLQAERNFIKLDCDDKIIVLTVDKHYIRLPGETVYLGYGLSHRRGNFTLMDTDREIKYLSDIIKSKK